MKLGYIRVSTIEQNEGRQLEALKDCEKIFVDKLSGKDTNRPQLKAMMDFAREDDVLTVESFSRLARSTVDLLNIVDKLTSKGVTVVSLKEGLNTATPQGRFCLTMFGALAQLEREQLLQRQREGIELAKSEGKYTGRQPIKVEQSTWVKNYTEWRAGEITAKKAMERLGLSACTFYRRVKEYENGGKA